MQLFIFVIWEFKYLLDELVGKHLIINSDSDFEHYNYHWLLK